MDTDMLETNMPLHFMNYCLFSSEVEICEIARAIGLNNQKASEDILYVCAFACWWKLSGKKVGIASVILDLLKVYFHSTDQSTIWSHLGSLLGGTTIDFSYGFLRSTSNEWIVLQISVLN
jgi:hypothetical protein